MEPTTAGAVDPRICSSNCPFQFNACSGRCSCVVGGYESDTVINDCSFTLTNCVFDRCEAVANNCQFRQYRNVSLSRKKPVKSYKPLVQHFVDQRGNSQRRPSWRELADLSNLSRLYFLPSFLLLKKSFDNLSSALKSCTAHSHAIKLTSSALLTSA
jgi:hypothetical protein